MKKAKAGFYYCPMIDEIYLVYQDGTYSYLFSLEFVWMQANWRFASGGCDYLGPL